MDNMRRTLIIHETPTSSFEFDVTLIDTVGFGVNFMYFGYCEYEKNAKKFEAMFQKRDFKIQIDDVVFHVNKLEAMPLFIQEACVARANYTPNES